MLFMARCNCVQYDIIPTIHSRHKTSSRSVVSGRAIGKKVEAFVKLLKTVKHENLLGFYGACGPPAKLQQYIFELTSRG